MGVPLLLSSCADDAQSGGELQGGGELAFVEESSI
jgi:hypothetical protein